MDTPFNPFSLSGPSAEWCKHGSKRKKNRRKKRNDRERSMDTSFNPVLHIPTRNSTHITTFSATRAEHCAEDWTHVYLSADYKIRAGSTGPRLSAVFIPTLCSTRITTRADLIYAVCPRLTNFNRSQKIAFFLIHV